MMLYAVILVDIHHYFDVFRSERCVKLATPLNVHLVTVYTLVNLDALSRQTGNDIHIICNYLMRSESERNSNYEQ